MLLMEMLKLGTVGIFCIFIIQISTQEIQVENSELKLLNYFQSKYREIKYIGPSKDINEPLEIKFSFLVTDINDLNEKTEIFSVNGIMVLSWTDPSLSWKPDNYNGVEEILLPEYWIWKPDISILNTLDMDDVTLDVYQRSRVRLHYSGLLHWHVLLTTATRCPLDLTFFPFDEHKCDILFGSWSQSSEDLKFLLDNNSSSNKTNGLDFSLLPNEHKSWSLIANTGHVSRNVIHFSIVLSRRMPIFTFSIFLPAFIILCLSLSIFWLPPTVMEKIVLGALNTKISVLLLLNIYWIIPQSDTSIPGIVLLCATSVCLTGISVIISVITVNISQKQNPPPSFIKWLKTSYVQNVFCLIYFQNQDTNPNVVSYSSQNEEIAIKHNNRKRKQINDWEFLAMFIDRAAFYLYCAVIIGIILKVFAPIQ